MSNSIVQINFVLANLSGIAHLVKEVFESTRVILPWISLGSQMAYPSSRNEKGYDDWQNRLASTLAMCVVYGIRRIRREYHGLKASIPRLELEVRLHVSAP